MKAVKAMICFTVFTVLSISMVGLAQNGNGEVKQVLQTICPVMGGKIKKDIYLDYKGKRIYFCCSGCAEEFKKDPEKYIEKLKDQGVTPEKSPTSEQIESD